MNSSSSNDYASAKQVWDLIVSILSVQSQLATAVNTYYQSFPPTDRPTFLVSYSSELRTITKKCKELLNEWRQAHAVQAATSSPDPLSPNRKWDLLFHLVYDPRQSSSYFRSLSGDLESYTGALLGQSMVFYTIEEGRVGEKVAHNNRDLTTSQIVYKLHELVERAEPEELQELLQLIELWLFKHFNKQYIVRFSSW